MLNDLFTLVREADSCAALRLLELIRDNSAGPEDVRGFIDETLSGLSGKLRVEGIGRGRGRGGGEAGGSGDISDSLVPAMKTGSVSASTSTSISTSASRASGSSLAASDTARTPMDKEKIQSTISKLEDVKDIFNVEGTEPPFRSKVMDLHYICDEAPIKVPAKPWTAVTDDDDLVSHLVSLYFTWDYPVNAFLDQDVFLKYMGAPGGTGPREGEFCSAFLVNALLSNACVSSSCFFLICLALGFVHVHHFISFEPPTLE